MTSLQHPDVGQPAGPTDPGRSLKLLSVVAPVYNEVATVEQFYARVCSALHGLSFELVPWQPILDKRIGQHIAGLQRDDGGIEWS
jgi:hypothetical protein